MTTGDVHADLPMQFQADLLGAPACGRKSSRRVAEMRTRREKVVERAKGWA